MSVEQFKLHLVPMRHAQQAARYVLMHHVQQLAQLVQVHLVQQEPLVYLWRLQ